MINLIFNNGYRWHSFYDILFKGYFYDREGRFLQGERAAEYFAFAMKSFDLHSLEKICCEIDGSWSVLLRQHGITLLASDTMSIFPLYYTQEEGKWLVSDSVSWLASRKKEAMLNGPACAEFLSAGFVLGSETLVKDIYRVRPGEAVLLNDDARQAVAGRTTWHYYLPQSFTDEAVESLEGELVAVLSEVTGRLLSSLRGERLVVPLSGGYDSRLIACMLKKSGYENVTCFTYGRPNPESVLSQKVAEKLGYEWIFVDYSRVDTSGYLEDPVFQAYHKYSGNYSSMPYLQEYFGVKYLKDNRLIPANSIFLPGHTGDYLAGSYLAKTIRMKGGHASGDLAGPGHHAMRPSEAPGPAGDLPEWRQKEGGHPLLPAESNREALPEGQRKQISRHIADRYFPFIPLDKKEKKAICERLEGWFGDYAPPSCATDPGYSVYVEDWDLKEKIAKFIFNSAGVFPCFGYGIRLPLWDAALREFFRKLPFRYRLNKALYDRVLIKHYFEPLGVSFGAEELPAPAGSGLPPCLMAARKKAGNMVKRLLPPALTERRIRKNDWICYHRFTREMVEELQMKNVRAPKRIYAYNALICAWYVEETRKLCNKLNAT
jgi:asparagine synthase (glutamine-hydrolysing)